MTKTRGRAKCKKVTWQERKARATSIYGTHLHSNIMEATQMSFDKGVPGNLSGVNVVTQYRAFKHDGNRTCDPQLLGRQRSEYGFKARLGKKSGRPPSPPMARLGGHTCPSSYVGSINRRIKV